MRFKWPLQEMARGEPSSVVMLFHVVEEIVEVHASSSSKAPKLWLDTFASED
jgi:hypothetical protein